MDILIQFLRDLLASGQVGIVIIALLVLIGGAIFIIWSQRQALSRIELNMKSADTARQQLQTTIEKQYDFVVKTNDELRKELDRYKNDQTKFESDVRKALAVGFDELKASLANVTVSEIVNQIPEKFKRDLENETSQATEHAIQSLIKRLKESETIENELFNNKDLEKTFREVSERSIRRVMDELNIDSFDPRWRQMITEAIQEGFHDFFRRYYNYDYPFLPLRERELDYLAEKIAYELRHHR